MKRTLMACAVIACAAGIAVAASPETDKAIKTIQGMAADPAKLKLICALDDADETPEGDAAKADPAQQKAQEEQIEGLLKQLGPDFEAAWDIGDSLDEKSPDAAEFSAAVEAIVAKCE